MEGAYVDCLLLLELGYLTDGITFARGSLVYFTRTALADTPVISREALSFTGSQVSQIAIGLVN